MCVRTSIHKTDACLPACLPASFYQQSGQMETKMFEVDMPESATIEAWRGVTAKIMLLVRWMDERA